MKEAFLNKKTKTVGLYLHIPFCRFLCHYCDFVKTARWTEGLVDLYFSALSKHLEFWIKTFLIPEGYKLGSVFVGGGTPSLFAKEYENIFCLIEPFLTEDAEITLEANPDNMSEENLRFWKSLGFNRISCGVQSFSSAGLEALTRKHKASEVPLAYERARKYFDSINLDLIYGWNGQTLEDWKQELAQLTKLSPDHASLYLLTYAPGTPIGRAHERGKIKASHDKVLESFYEMARSSLAEAGYAHEEVSNWSKGGKSCRHNWLYWQDQYYLALGAGACGYLPSSLSPFGMRYQYTGREKSFSNQKLPQEWISWDGKSELLGDHFLIEERSDSIWLLEYLGAALRSSRGVDLGLIRKKTDYSYRESLFLETAVKEGCLRQEGNRLLLSEREWFRESSWCLKIFEAFSEES